MGTAFSGNRFLIAVAAGVVIAYGVILALLFFQHRWILDGMGHPLPVDFLSFWSAGKLALMGHGAFAYDWRLLHGLHRQIVGHDFAGYYGWGYPPLFFCVAALLALLPYGAAFVAWLAATLALYAGVIAKITRRKSPALIAVAAPAVLGNMLAGQNGFLSAALIGVVLATLASRPVLSGILLGLLTYKPHLGILFPLALAFGGYWRTLISAALCGAVIALANLIAAPDTLWAFSHSLHGMGITFLSQGSAGWYKIQSLYGLMRQLGFGEGWGYGAQGLLLLILVAGLAWLWRSKKPLALKCAALAAATLLATPYLYMYDFPILSVAIAFLYRQREFDRIELAGIIAANLLIAAFIAIPAPLGLGAGLIIAALILRRVKGPAGRVSLAA